MLLFDLGLFVMNTMYQIQKLTFELEFKSFRVNQIFTLLRIRTMSSQWIFSFILTFHQKVLKAKKLSSLLKWDKREINWLVHGLYVFMEDGSHHTRYLLW